MMSIFAVFIVELVSQRWGASQLRRRELKKHDTESKSESEPDLTRRTHELYITASPPTSLTNEVVDQKRSTDEEAQLTPYESNVDETSAFSETAVAEIIGVGILELGVIFHSMIIGLTLAVTDGFVILFIVITFHRRSDPLGFLARH
jgi:zinc transporter 1/2/3